MAYCSSDKQSNFAIFGFARPSRLAGGPGCVPQGQRALAVHYLLISAQPHRARSNLVQTLI